MIKTKSAINEIKINLDFVQNELNRRRPGQSKIVTQRNELDEVEFYSGIFEGVTTGTPIGFIIKNTNHKPKDYSHIKSTYRPSHADYVYDKKYWQGNGKSYFQLKFGMDCLREVSANLKNKNIPLHIFEGNYEELKNWIEINFPKSVIYMNHFTDIDYYRTKTNVFKRFYADLKRIKIFENFGIQTKNFNRDAWSFDWQKIMTKPILSEVKTSDAWSPKSSPYPGDAGSLHVRTHTILLLSLIHI